MRGVARIAALTGAVAIACSFGRAEPARAQAVFFGSGVHAGPSFSCNGLQDSLAELICSDRVLSKIDLEFVQTYYVLRQQTGAYGLKALKDDAIQFDRAVRARCGFAPGLAAPPGAGQCVSDMYRQQREAWRKLLTGPAAEEAARPIEQHLERNQPDSPFGLYPQ